ncbi:hypothetical protein JKA74_16520 [Marivirga sp. S37H4]|uniref:Secretion system C-terminal sorting domain-containing protein n=1 Tax=Marivirga aurantiaca TaxID=2802615 RepID=A0A935CB94_9BACT|nr:hypothetical protein [Marivirga aurantiaca]MBK6266652.1 hypothetical protein [Marivirga aurantiaca]
MKKTKITQIAAVLLLIILPLVSFASGAPVVKLTKGANKMLTLRVGAIQSESIKVTLKDNFGHLLFSEQVTEKNEFIKRFDLNNLKSGHYKIEVESEMNIRVMPVQVNWEDIEIMEQEFSVLNKPFIKMNANGIFDFNLLNLESQKTTVLILDDKGKVVYKDYLGAFAEYKRRYDLSQLDKGNYNIIVNKGNRSYEKLISN